MKLVLLIVSDRCWDLPYAIQEDCSLTLSYYRRVWLVLIYYDVMDDHNDATSWCLLTLLIVFQQTIHLLLRADHDQSMDQTSHDESTCPCSDCVNVVIDSDSCQHAGPSPSVSWVTDFLASDLWIFKKYRFDVNLVYTTRLHPNCTTTLGPQPTVVVSTRYTPENDDDFVEWTPMLVYTDAG